MKKANAGRGARNAEEGSSHLENLFPSPESRVPRSSFDGLELSVLHLEECNRSIQSVPLVIKTSLTQNPCVVDGGKRRQKFFTVRPGGLQNRQDDIHGFIAIGIVWMNFFTGVARLK